MYQEVDDRKILSALPSKKCCIASKLLPIFACLFPEISVKLYPFIIVIVIDLV